MNILEFVTVKDNLLEFLKTNRNEVIDSDAIIKDLKFFSLPNGVIEACIEEMVSDKSIIIRQKESKSSFIIAESGVMLLAAGGYVKKLIEDKKLRPNTDEKSDTLYMPSVLYRRNKQISVIASSLNTINMLSSVLFKRI